MLQIGLNFTGVITFFVVLLVAHVIRHKSWMGDFISIILLSPPTLSTCDIALNMAVFFFFFVIRARSICPRCTAAFRLIVQPLSPPQLIFLCSHFRRQVPLSPYDARDPSSEKWNCGRECWPVILPKYRLPRFIQGSYTCRKSATWDWRLYFPSNGRRAEDFFTLKNPDGLGQVWTCELGYLKAARYP